jgi:hypothetical protein
MTTKGYPVYSFLGGKYYVGDIGYVFPGDWYARRARAGVPATKEHFLFFGRPVVEFAVNDGGYAGSDGNTYPVDSAHIGIIWADDVRLIPEGVRDEFVGSIIIFEKPFTVYRDGDTLFFGHLEIDVSQPRE